MRLLRVLKRSPFIFHYLWRSPSNALTVLALPVGIIVGEVLHWVIYSH